MVVFAEDVLLKDSKSSCLPFLQVKNTTKSESVIGIKRKSSSASVFCGGYGEKWEGRSEHSAVTPCASHLISQQFPCSDARWLQHSPEPSARGAWLRQWIWMLLSLSKQPRSFGPCIENSLDWGCSAAIPLWAACMQPLWCAAPAAGRGSLTLGSIGPVPQSCWLLWILVFLLGFLFCFLSPHAAVSSCYSNWHCLCIKRSSSSQFWWKNVEEGILFGETGCIKEK